MSRLALVAHDAGGAELLSSWLRREGRTADALCVLDGPARQVFERKLGAVESLPLAQALDGAERVLTGTGWQSSLERDALREAARRGLPSAAYLDHWVHYRERFVRDGEAVWPDEFWVGDEDALALAARLLPERPHRLVPNPYFADLRDELARAPARPAGAPRLLLYVCEPIADHARHQFGNPRHWGYDEFDALRFTLRHLGAFDGAPFGRIVVRRHPAEAADKYAPLVAEFASLPLVLGGQLSLVDEVAAADVVAGCHSMAMVIGLLAAKPVYCSIPPGGGACTLPQAQIRLLRERVPAVLAG